MKGDEADYRAIGDYTPMTKDDLSDSARAVFKIQITIESREDGGMRVYSDDLPGLILSGAQSEKVIGDISPALLEIMKYLSEHQPERLAK